MKRSIWVILAVFFIGVIFFFLQRRPQTENIQTSPQITNSEKNSVNINNVEIKVEIADDPDEQQAGLSGRRELGENEGMLFISEPKSQLRTFWMKGMLIPLDIIWIGNGKIVGIEKNVPAPHPDTPLHELELYGSKVPVDYVLEVNAGFSDKNNIKVGDPIEINIDN